MLVHNLSLFLLILMAGESFAQEEQVFWKRKSKIFGQIINERKIVVSSKVLNHGQGERMRVIGAGLVRAPLSHTLDVVKQFENLPEVSEYFKKVKHDKGNKKVYLYIKAFGYDARLLLKYFWNKRSGEGHQLDWVVTWGRLEGMQGHFQFESFGEKKTLMSAWVSFDTAKIPLPDFLMGFTLEVIAEKVAQKMRNFIETKKTQDKGVHGKSGR